MGLRCSGRFLAASASTAGAACAQTICMILWPLFIKGRFGWEAHEYAYLTGVQKILLVAFLAFYARSVHTPGWGQQRALLILALLGTLCIAAFAVGRPGHASSSDKAVHVLLGIPGLVSVWTLASSFEAAAARCAPAEDQGWALGALNTASAIGALVGSLVGPATWSWSLAQIDVPDGEGTVWPWLLRDGRAPFLLITVLLLGMVALLVVFDLEPAPPMACGETQLTDVEGRGFTETAEVIGVKGQGDSELARLDSEDQDF